ncbi:MAG TPA: HNH endonuclease [Pyrinomonadaceae bacterium]|jgi:uncharacterized protein (TIGR02646 family)
MIRLPTISLPRRTEQQLAGFQGRVDAIVDYEDRVREAKRLFSLYNKSTNAAFKVVRAKLVEMCSGARRCCYCEDSFANQVEHIKPKDLYPEETFLWKNYVYACSRCNGPKNNKFAVFSSATGGFVDITPARRVKPRVKPETGTPVLINPRWEDPLAFMALDLAYTFRFVPIKSVGSKDYERARYTIEVLGLNAKDPLTKAREEAFLSYRSRLSDYIKMRDKGASKRKLDFFIKAMKGMQHPSVWKEMIRQRKISTLRNLFDRAPEALKW